MFGATSTFCAYLQLATWGEKVSLSRGRGAARKVSTRRRNLFFTVEGPVFASTYHTYVWHMFRAPMCCVVVAMISHCLTKTHGTYGVSSTTALAYSTSLYIHVQSFVVHRLIYVTIVTNMSKRQIFGGLVACTYVCNSLCFPTVSREEKVDAAIVDVRGVLQEAVDHLPNRCRPILTGDI